MSLELDSDLDLDLVCVWGLAQGTHTPSGHPGMPRCGRDHNALLVHDYEPLRCESGRVRGERRLVQFHV